MLVLLDRDGVITQDMPEGINRVEDLRFVPRACEAIAMLTRCGFKTAICSNQSAIGKGLLTVEGFQAIHDSMLRMIEYVGGRIDATFIAPDHPDYATLRRKPGPGMLQEALQQFGADPQQTPMVGDMLRDLEAATAAGCPRMLVRTGKGAQLEAHGIPPHVGPVMIFNDLYDAALSIVAGHC